MQFSCNLNAVQELQPEESISDAALYYNEDIRKIEQQIAQSKRKKSSEDGRDGGSQDGGEVTQVQPE